MHFFEVNGKRNEKTGNVQQNNNQKSKKSTEEQLREIDAKIKELRDSLDIYTSAKDFAKIQEQIEELQRKRYKILANNK